MIEFPEILFMYTYTVLTCLSLAKRSKNSSEIVSINVKYTDNCSGDSVCQRFHPRSSCGAFSSETTLSLLSDWSHLNFELF